MKIFLVTGKNEWKSGTRQMLVVGARTKKEAREIARDSRSMDGGVTSVRELSKLKRPKVFTVS